jgi:hypothetical protein
VKGRLHTRYAPVRRSQKSKLSLPLDLHVLSLPLAFILSQDQTLHRILCEFQLIETLFILTEGLVVFSNLSILLLFILCLKISLKTAVNSICLGTCSSCFFPLNKHGKHVSRSGCKSTTSFQSRKCF